MKRYEALPADVRAAMENRFMWAVTTGPSHPDATAEKAVETIVSPLLDHHQGAVEALAEAIRLLDDARPTTFDPGLRRSWAQKRGALRRKWGQ